jgi:hypothetical protein
VALHGGLRFPLQPIALELLGITPERSARFSGLEIIPNEFLLRKADNAANLSTRSGCCASNGLLCVVRFELFLRFHLSLLMSVR